MMKFGVFAPSALPPMLEVQCEAGHRGWIAHGTLPGRCTCGGIRTKTGRYAAAVPSTTMPNRLAHEVWIEEEDNTPCQH